ncbi:hypothetical protein [Haloglomus halophilum]|uniref:hypothetical protein n=1 Tax=Haloglomus halophilum TaxID=2962672 RepID=UPI0020C981B5|nr:hypothetical protein [Haloglomus halophilum]
MGQTTRRGVLATMGVLATAGCSSVSGLGSGGSDDSGGSGDGADGGSGGSLRKETVKEVSRSVTLKQDQFEAVPLSFDRQTVLFFSVVADRNVDVLTFRRPDFETYRTDAADQLRFVDALSEQRTEATSQGSAVSPGEPVVVVDNTTWGETQPSQRVDIELELEAFIRDDGSSP